MELNSIYHHYQVIELQHSFLCIQDVLLPELLHKVLLLMKYRRLIVDKALQVDIQRLSNVVEGLDVDGDGAVFVLGKGGLALVDHGRKLLDGVATALAVLLDPLAHMIGKGTHR